MYSIKLEVQTESSPQKSVSIENADAKSLHELIGRYTMKYGMPFEGLARLDGGRVLHFYEKTKFGFREANIYFWLSKHKPQNVTPTSNVKPVVKEHDKIQALIDAGLFT